MVVLPAALGIAAYKVSLSSAATMLGQRRERVLAVVEGRD
jgi:hypothetical protein